MQKPVYAETTHAGGDVLPFHGNPITFLRAPRGGKTSMKQEFPGFSRTRPTGHGRSASRVEQDELGLPA